MLSLVDRMATLPPGVRSGAAVEALASRTSRRRPRDGADERLRKALLAGLPDRVAQEGAGFAAPALASGHGAVLSRDSGVREAEFLVALDVAAGARGPGSEALVRLASRVERDG